MADSNLKTDNTTTEEIQETPVKPKPLWSRIELSTMRHYLDNLIEISERFELNKRVQRAEAELAKAKYGKFWNVDRASKRGSTLCSVYKARILARPEDDRGIPERYLFMLEAQETQTDFQLGLADTLVRLAMFRQQVVEKIEAEEWLLNELLESIAMCNKLIEADASENSILRGKLAHISADKDRLRKLEDELRKSMKFLQDNREDYEQMILECLRMKGGDREWKLEKVLRLLEKSIDLAMEDACRYDDEVKDMFDYAEELKVIEKISFYLESTRGLLTILFDVMFGGDLKGEDK